MAENKDLEIDDIRSEILSFNNDASVQKLNNLYHSKSFSEILGVDRKEATHSNFLAWLLNDEEDHSLSKFPLRKFIEVIARLDKKQFSKNKDFFDTVIVSSYDISNIEVFKEKHSGNGRVDLYVKSSVSYLGKQKDLKIIIENKVAAKESNKQTLRYFKNFKTDKNSEIVLFVYLTPISNIDLAKLEEPQTVSKEFIHINYQTIVDYLLEPILKRNASERTKMIVNEYIKSLSQTTMDKNSNEHKPNLIMALSTEERNLLNDFWDKNQKIIKAALHARSIDKNVDEEDRKAYSKVLEIENTMTIGEYVRATFRDLYKRNLLDVTEIENLKDLEYSNKNFKTNFPILRDGNKSIEISGVNRYYTPEKFCGNYSLTSQWYFDKNMDSFNTWLKGIYAKHEISQS